jgi:hypothetical protein
MNEEDMSHEELEAALKRFEAPVALRELERNVRVGARKAKSRADTFLKAYRARFEIKKKRGLNAPDVLVSFIFRDAIELYCLGQIGAMLVDLCGTIEFYLARDLPKIVARDELSADFIRPMFQRKSVLDFAHMLKDVGLWKKADVDFCRSLVEHRNAIAHKNAVLAERLLGRARGELDAIEVKDEVDKLDGLPFLLGSMEIVWRLVKMMTDATTDDETQTPAESNKPRA